MNTSIETTAADQLKAQANEYAQRRTAIANSLDECGIGHDVGDRMRAGNEYIATFIGEVSRKIYGQFNHDLLVNVPHRIVSTSNATGQGAVNRALPGICGSFVKWDINAALRLCAEILDDVNAHAEAKKVLEMIG